MKRLAFLLILFSCSNALAQIAPQPQFLSNGIYNLVPPTLANGQIFPFQLDVNGRLKVDSTATVIGSVTATISGPVTVVQPTGSSLHADIDNVVAVSGAFFQAVQPVSQSGTWTVIANQGTSPWVISGNVTEANSASINSNIVTISTQLSSVTGTPGAAPPGLAIYNGSKVSTAAPAYSNNTIQPLSLTTAGALRTDASGSTQPISGTVNAVQSGAWTTGRTWSLLNTTDSVNAVQSGVWTVQQGTPPWSVSQSGTWTTGRTWSLLNTTDSVNAVQSGTWTTARSWTLSHSTDSVNAWSFDGSGNAIGSTTLSAVNYLDVWSPSMQQNGGAIAARADMIAGNDTLGGVGRYVSVNTAGQIIVDGNIASGSADSGNPVKVGGVFNTVPPTLASGNRGNLQLDSTGNLKTAVQNTVSDNIVQYGGTNLSTGTGASGAGIPRVTISNDSSLAANQSVNVAQVNGVTTSVGNGVSGTGVQRVAIASDNTPFPVKLDDGSGASVTVGQKTMANSLPVTIASDQTIVTWSYVHHAGAATTLVKTGAGTFHAVCQNGQAGVTSIFDNTVGSGTTIAIINASGTPNCLTYDVAFATGLTIVTTNAANDITATYK